MLRFVLSESQNTEFASDHGLDRRMTLDDYRAAVPVRRHEELRPWIDRSADGEPNPLVKAPIEMFTRTSGSELTPRLIPVTRAFRRMLAESHLQWLAGAIEHHRVPRGKIFVTTSPVAHSRTKGGHPVGSINGLVSPRAFGGRLLTVTQEIHQTSPFTARTDRLLELTLGEELAVIATPNPSILIYFFERLREVHRLTPREAWPGLALIGCWTASSSSLYLPQLGQLTENLPVCDIGYGASEGYFAPHIATIGPGALPAAHQFIFELYDGDRLVELEAAELGRAYRLVVTTAWGLHRYDTEDLLEVVGHYQRLPLLRFVHRTGAVVSIAGEKVTESQVVDAVLHAQRTLGCSIGDFVARIEWPPDSRPRYRFELLAPDGDTEALARCIDERLRETNVEYATRRFMLRLDRASVVVVQRDRFDRLMEGSPAPLSQIKLRHLERTLPGPEPLLPIQ